MSYILEMFAFRRIHKLLPLQFSRKFSISSQLYKYNVNIGNEYSGKKYQEIGGQQRDEFYDSGPGNDAVFSGRDFVQILAPKLLS